MLRCVKLSARPHPPAHPPRVQASAGWPAWSHTLPSLEDLVDVALEYFVANDLYQAACR